MSVSIGKTDRRVILTTGLRAAAALIRWNAWRLYRGVSAASRPCYLARPPPPPLPRIRASLRFFLRAEARCLSARYRRAWLTRTGEEKPAEPLLLRVSSSSSFFLSFLVVRQRSTRSGGREIRCGISGTRYLRLFEESRKIFLDYGDGEL